MKDVITVLNIKGLMQVDAIVRKSLEETAEQVVTDVKNSQTMPFRTGQLQNDSTFADISESKQGVVHLVSSTPYARRLYYHPEYHFSQFENEQAGAGWFEPYKNGGSKFNQVLGWYKQFMKRNGGI